MEQDDLIKKWLNDELTATEKAAFQQMDDAEFNQYLIDHAQQFKASHFSKMDDFETFKQRYGSEKSSIKKLNWWSPILKIASVIIVSLGLYFTLFNSSKIQIETLASEKTTIELPDHSEVILNALSSITYDAKNWEDQRALLLEGEAYFKVTKGQTFDVKTSTGTVTVVGTQFNVKQRHDYFEVTCFEGIVRVTSDTITRRLLAGDTYRILNGVFSEGKTTEVSPSWSDDMSHFDRVPVKEVLAELERQFDVQVTVKDIDTNRLFTGGFKHDDLESALIAITQPLHMTYEISTAKVVVIHGTTN